MYLVGEEILTDFLSIYTFMNFRTDLFLKIVIIIVFINCP